jgi:hypothetical protein
VNKRDIRETDKAENVAQIGFLKIELFPGSAFFIGASARGDDKDLLISQQSVGTLWPVSDRLPDSHNLIDPCLEQGRDREVVHGRSDDERVRRLYLFDQGIGCGEIIPVGRSQLRRFDLCRIPIIGNEREHCCGEVSMYDFTGWVVRSPFLSELSC